MLAYVISGVCETFFKYLSDRIERRGGLVGDGRRDPLVDTIQEGSKVVGQ